MMGLASGLVAGCASSGNTPRPRPFPNTDYRKPSDPKTPAQPSGPATGAPAGNGTASTGDPADSSYAPPGIILPPAPHVPGALGSSVFDGRALAEYALGFRGVPYRLGGADPTGGFDCSGLVQYVFAHYGVSVPRVVEEQYEFGEKIKDKDIKPGDLLFFATNREWDNASHVAIAIGEERFVHAPNSRGVVRVEALTSDYWGSHYVGARRVAGGDSN